MLYPNGPRRKSRFAFVIHPLSQKFFRNVEPLGTIARSRRRRSMDVVEKALAYAAAVRPTATSPASRRRPAPRPRAG